MANVTKVICKNVFKNDDKVIFRKMFTLKWVELINLIEKSTEVNTPYK